MNILLVDDDKATRESVEMFITGLGHEVSSAGSGHQGLDLFRNGNFQLVITDIQMPDMDGFELMREIRNTDRPLVDVVVITGHSNVDNTITALREGAYDYLQKPINVAELSIVIERVIEHLSLKQTTAELTNHFEARVREEVTETETKLENIARVFRDKMGLANISIHSRKLEELFALADRFRSSPSVPVLIEGETGTGKEVLAQYIHFGSGLSSKPFVAINCAAIPAELFESELFGHEPGSFTGAGTSTKKGKLELAEDGTLLLDEIGDMPVAMQAKLLRVLEEREFYRVGGVRKLTFRARVIASTNRTLEHEAAEGRFRSDLYHRLNVGYIEIPPLRERREEIAPLARDFLAAALQHHGNKTVQGMAPEAENYLRNQQWPGNIRQLQNAVERAVILYETPLLKPEHFAFLEHRHGASADQRDANQVVLDDNVRFLIPPEGIDLDEVINRLIEEAFRMSNNNKTTAAKLLNISPRTISRRLEKLDDNE